MPKDLDQELDEGRRAAKALVLHLTRLGASNADILVWLQDEEYIVSVRHIPFKSQHIQD